MNQNSKIKKPKKKEAELDKFFEKEEENDDDNNINVNQKIINNENLSSAIKWFMVLVLFSEKDKKSKIKDNKRNIFNYLNTEDLWDRKIFKDKKFNNDLNELKKLNIQTNKIIWLYDYLVKGEEEEEENYIEQIKEYKEKKEAKPENKKSKKKPGDSSESESDDDNDKDKYQ